MTRAEIERGIAALNTIAAGEKGWPKEKMRALAYLRGLLNSEMRSVVIREAMDGREGA